MEEQDKEQILERIRIALKKAIDQQILEQNPPQTKEVWQKLLDLGATEEESYELIGKVVSETLFKDLKEESEFKMASYIEALNHLPIQFEKLKKQNFA